MDALFAFVFAFFRKRPGLFLLCLLLLTIAIVSVKPSYFLVGWDNYSSYFNIKTNIFRTFFATWRDYRGLGVPSDSEATDIFRQLFYLILSPLLSKMLLDQLYMVLAVVLGTLAMYGFSYIIAKRYVTQTNVFFTDLFAAFSAFFYLFNLNTLATFYFPMIMYINRYWSLPTLFLMFFLLLHNRFRAKRWLFIIGIGMLLTSGTYVTATNIITILIALCAFGLFQGNIKRFVGIFFLYIAIQAFWLLPFFNYTVQKSPIIRLAPTFINANETLLNKSKEFYSFEKQIILYPNFFETEFYDISQIKKLHFHPMAALLEKPFYRLTLLIFPALYLAGFALLVVRARTYARLLWLPCILFLFLFLSMKEFSPLGFVYHFIDNLSPFFGVLFRFGDTKFHPLIAFAGSITAAFFLVSLITFLKRHKFVAAIPAAGIVICTIFIFRTYVTGQLIGTFMYNKIPQAYFSIADFINNDLDDFRVLQLPMSEEDYWKSYTWGMFGSSFLHFMLDKPIIEKTFEPASMENAYMHQAINDLLANFQLISSESGRRKRAEAFANLLSKLGVKYLIFDDTVQAAIPTRDILLWGKFNNADVSAMIRALMDTRLLTRVKDFSVRVEDSKGQKSAKTIALFLLPTFSKKVSFLPQATYIDAKLHDLLKTDLVLQDRHWLQDAKSNSVALYPFLRSDLAFQKNRNTIAFEMPILSQEIKPQRLIIPNSESSNGVAQLVDVEAEKHEKSLILRFFHRRTPTINTTATRYLVGEIEIPLAKIGNDEFVTTKVRNYVSDWAQLPYDEFGGLRLLLGDYVIPIPSRLAESPSLIGTVALRNEEIPLQLLRITKRVPLDLSSFSFTITPNCFFDTLQDSSYSAAVEQGVLQITSTNQSTCLFYDLQPILQQEKTSYIEVGLQLDGRSTDLDGNYSAVLGRTTKPSLTSYVRSLPKPNLLRACIKEANVDACYNLHQFIAVKENTSAIFPLERPLNGTSDMVLLLSPKNTGYQQQAITVKDIYVDEYEPVFNGSLDARLFRSEVSIDVPQGNGNSLSFTLPQVLSPYSFFAEGADGLYGLNDVCDPKEGYRTYRIQGEKLLSYFEHCYNDLFQKVPFLSDNFSLWILKYNLLSGKYPRLVINDNIYSYNNAYISLNQGYPDVQGFKSFQAPEVWLNTSSAQEVKKKLDGVPLVSASGFVGPIESLYDTSQKDIAIHQDGENEGAMLVKNVSFLPLPVSWKNLRIETGQPEQSFFSPSSFHASSLLPSLWKVEGQGIANKTLLLFNEGYDTQWRVYDGIFGVLFGIGTSHTPSRCDGYANCFVLEDKNAVETLYIVYTPERLNVLGWGITILGLILLVRLRSQET